MGVPIQQSISFRFTAIRRKPSGRTGSIGSLRCLQWLALAVWSIPCKYRAAALIRAVRTWAHHRGEIRLNRFNWRRRIRGQDAQVRDVITARAVRPNPPKRHTSPYLKKPPFWCTKCLISNGRQHSTRKVVLCGAGILACLGAPHSLRYSHCCPLLNFPRAAPFERKQHISLNVRADEPNQGKGKRHIVWTIQQAGTHLKPSHLRDIH